AVEEAANALGSVDARYRSLGAQREAAEAALARLEAQVSAKAVQLRGLEMELTTLTSSVEADEKGLREARQRMESFVQFVQPGEEGSHHLEARQRDLHSPVMSSQNRLFESERQALDGCEWLSERHGLLAGQLGDLAGAEKSLHRAIEELTTLMRKRFETTCEKVARGFEQYFKAFFGGGQAELSLTYPKVPSNSGVEVEARPPGKRTKTLAQLSGGEKALTSVSLLFALLQANPSPFCVLDEVD